jgi:ABC-type Fe3+/spermidine/putrescine transport system ATPase subunit
MTRPEQTPEPEPAMSLRGLVKRFDTKLAVAGVDLDVPAGSFYGLLGPNGAGKTTTLSMAVGLLRPDAGTAVLGHDVWADPVAAKRAARRAARRRAPVRPAHRRRAAGLPRAAARHGRATVDQRPASCSTCSSSAPATARWSSTTRPA